MTPDMRRCCFVSNAYKGKGVLTPGEADQKDTHLYGEFMALGDATAYREQAARANNLALERQDIQYAMKEMCRIMSQLGTNFLLVLRGV